MSNIYCRFDGSDITVGPDFAIFLKDSRAIKISGLDRDGVVWVKELCQRKITLTPDAMSAIAKGLIASNILETCKRRDELRVKVFRLQLPSKTVTFIAKPITHICNSSSLKYLFLATMFIQAFAISVFLLTISFSLPNALTVSDGLYFLFLVVVSKVAHELGHAALSLELTQAVGRMRVGRSGLRWTFVLDVSNIDSLNTSQRRAIFAAGPVLQSFLLANIVLLETAFRQNHDLISILILYSMLSAALNWIPSNYGNDGSNVFTLSKINLLNPLPSKLGVKIKLIKIFCNWVWRFLLLTSFAFWALIASIVFQTTVSR